MAGVEAEIAEWRAWVRRAPAIDGRDVEELEAHLRDQVGDLEQAGLAPDEAFLVAVKRMGSVDALSLEFAHEHSGRLWRQLVVARDDADDASTRLGAALGWAVAAAVAVQVARLVAGFPGDQSWWLVRNASLLVLPALAGFFAHRRGLSPRRWALAAVPFAVAAVVVNAVSWPPDSGTELLVAAHLPVVLWFAVAHPYTGGDVASGERRMDWVRFSGEWFIYYVLLALGGGVLMGLAVAILEPAGVDIETWIVEWVLPCGAAGAVVVAAWLVESKQQVVENMAPVLTMVFTPLFALLLAVSAVVYAATGLGGAFDRELLGIFDAMLVVVLGLVLYGMSARDPAIGPGWMDRVQLGTVAAALVLDAMVLVVMVERIGQLGFTPNRTAALGLNLVLLVNLAGTAWLSGRFVLGRGTFHRIERWQTDYLPVLAAWAITVVVVLPPLFGFA